MVKFDFRMETYPVLVGVCMTLSDSWRYLKQISEFFSFAETGLQELRQGTAGPEEDRDQLGPAPQDHRLPGGGLRRGAHPRAGQAEGRGQLLAAAGHAGRPVLPPASGRPPEAVRPRSGLWHSAHLPAAHRPPERRPAGERGQPRGTAGERPGKEQGQAVLRSLFHSGPSHSKGKLMRLYGL